MNIVEEWIRKLKRFKGPKESCRKCEGKGYIIVMHEGCPFDKTWLMCPACCGKGELPKDPEGEK